MNSFLNKLKNMRLAINAEFRETILAGAWATLICFAIAGIFMAAFVLLSVALSHLGLGWFVVCIAAIVLFLVLFLKFGTTSKPKQPKE
jgi:hypothetical protein